MDELGVIIDRNGNIHQMEIEENSLVVSSEDFTISKNIAGEFVLYAIDTEGDQFIIDIFDTENAAQDFIDKATEQPFKVLDLN